MRKPSVADRILLLLSIKEEGKYIGMDHIYEKVARDTKAFEKIDLTKSELESEVKLLIANGLVEESAGKYAITDKGETELDNRLKEISEGLNLSYVTVWKARKYYPEVARALLPFLTDRPVSVIKVFSGKEDPIHQLEPLFVRYKRYKPKPQFISISNEQELLAYVDDHCVDFIPYVSKFNSNYPDYLILDLDAGERLKQGERGFLMVKAVAEAIVDLMEEARINYLLKFSGSRGFQIWAALDNSNKVISEKPDAYSFYRQVAVEVRNYVEKKLEEDRSWIEEYGLGEVKWPVTSSIVAKKEERSDQILIDWSSMKPNGDVRAPYSMHYKTAMISLPIFPSELRQFKRETASVENVMAAPIKEFPPPAPSDPSALFRILGIT
ncbi:non-homologous end-joining DNA ligase LigD [Tardisphaera saccharovorans]|nr:hypothetical protein [TACK group archaeon]